MLYRRRALLFFGVIHQISRSHGQKNRRFESNLSKITRPVAAIKSLRFAWFYLTEFAKYQQCRSIFGRAIFMVLKNGGSGAKMSE